MAYRIGLLDYILQLHPSERYKIVVAFSPLIFYIFIGYVVGILDVTLLLISFVVSMIIILQMRDHFESTIGTILGTEDEY